MPKPIDPKIKEYLRKINAFDFVESELSCQGHFCKRAKDYVAYYGSYEKVKTTSRYHGRVAHSRVKSPFVILRFPTRSITKEFLKYWIANRDSLCRNKIWLYMVTPKNEKSVIFLKDGSIFVSEFNNTHVSVSYFVAGYIGVKYYQNKKAYDDRLVKARGTLFRVTLQILEFMKENADQKKPPYI